MKEHVLNKTIIELIRRNDRDSEIVDYIDRWLKDIFWLGFDKSEATSASNSFFMHDDLGDIPNKDLVELMKELYPDPEFFSRHDYRVNARSF